MKPPFRTVAAAVPAVEVCGIECPLLNPLRSVRRPGAGTLFPRVSRVRARARLPAPACPRALRGGGGSRARLRPRARGQRARRSSPVRFPMAGFRAGAGQEAKRRRGRRSLPAARWYHGFPAVNPRIERSAADDGATRDPPWGLLRRPGPARQRTAPCPGGARTASAPAPPMEGIQAAAPQAGPGGLPACDCADGRFEAEYGP